MKAIIILLFTTFSLPGICQLNCNVFKSDDDDACYKACNLANEAAQYQGLKASQEMFDQAISLCPTLDYSYFEKSVPYLKRGDFVTWKKLIDKAVELNPRGNLGYRGWCRYQFVRDYEGAVEDLEKLDSMLNYDMGYSSNGDYNLTIVKGLCYKALGQRQKAIQIIEEKLSEKGYSPMNYDYLHLGVLKFENGDDEDAVAYFEKSIQFNDYLAEPYYYLGLIAKKQNDLGAVKQYMEKAKAYYMKGYTCFDHYTHPMDKIFLSDIEKELAKL